MVMHMWVLGFITFTDILFKGWGEEQLTSHTIEQSFRKSLLKGDSVQKNFVVRGKTACNLFVN